MSKKEDDAYLAWVEELKEGLKEKPEALKALTLLTTDEAAGARDLFRGSVGGKEISRRMNELSEAKKALEEQAREVETNKNKWGSWYQEAQVAHNQVLSENANLKKELQRARVALPDEDEENKVSQIRQDVYTKAEVEEREKALLEQVRRVDNGAVHYTNKMLAIAIRASKDKIDFDPDKIMKRAVEENCDPMRAYELETAEVLADRQTQEAEKREKEAYERGKREAASTTTPDSGFRFQSAGPTPSESILSGSVKALSANDRLAAALKTFTTVSGQA